MKPEGNAQVQNKDNGLGLVNPNHVSQKPARNALSGEASMICPPPLA